MSLYNFCILFSCCFSHMFSHFCCFFNKFINCLQKPFYFIFFILWRFYLVHRHIIFYNNNFSDSIARRPTNSFIHNCLLLTPKPQSRRNMNRRLINSYTYFILQVPIQLMRQCFHKPPAHQHHHIQLLSGNHISYIPQ